MPNSYRRPVVLVVLDGWGYRAEREGNAIALANTPTWDALWMRQPRTLLEASGLAVGLPCGQMGNSEVGHLNLGAGRVVPQDLVRISEAIDDGSFSRVFLQSRWIIVGSIAAFLAVLLVIVGTQFISLRESKQRGVEIV